MANSKKELVKRSKDLIDDIFDNYDEYTDEEKHRIQSLMNQMSNLNLDLDKYDKQSSKRKSLWERFTRAVGDFFGKK